MIDRWRMRRKFEKYVSPGVRKLLEEDPSKFIPDLPEKKHFQFFVISLDETNPHDISSLTAEVADQVFQHHGMIHSMTSSLVVGWMGYPFVEYDSAENRRQLVNSLLRTNGSRLRIAHGECTSLLGNFGAKTRFNYGVLIPGFSYVLRKLLDTPFGAAIEIESPGAQSS